MGVAIAGCIIVIVFAILTSASSAASLYYVGDSSGWTLNVNYTLWASNHAFSFGDSIVFNYSSSTHTALVVTESDYVLCNINSPLAAVQSGVPFLIQGRKNYFICGVPGHCITGMKVAILASPPSSTIIVPSCSPSSPHPNILLLLTIAIATAICRILKP